MFYDSDRQLIPDFNKDLNEILQNAIKVLEQEITNILQDCFDMIPFKKENKINQEEEKKNEISQDSIIPKDKITIIDILNNKNDVKKIIKYWEQKQVIDKIAKNILYHYKRGNGNLNDIKKDILQEDNIFLDKVRVNIFENFFYIFLNSVSVDENWIKDINLPNKSKIKKRKEIIEANSYRMNMEEIAKAIVTWYAIRFIPLQYWEKKREQYITYPIPLEVLGSENNLDTLYKIILQNYGNNNQNIKNIKIMDRKILEYMYVVVLKVFLESLNKGYDEIIRDPKKKLSDKSIVRTYVSRFMDSKFVFMILNSVFNIDKIVSNYVKQYGYESLEFMISEVLVTYNILLGSLETIWRFFQKISDHEVYELNGIMRYFRDLTVDGIMSVLFIWFSRTVDFEYFVNFSSLSEVIVSSKSKNALDKLKNIFRKFVGFMAKSVRAGRLVFSYIMTIELTEKEKIEKATNVELLLFEQHKKGEENSLKIPEKLYLI
ncbi:MAG: hypothetical protein NZM44_02020 [Candidatus Calescibacterium sp.]|nr:hypothetical protein [Candidatus Calescibacterium sp.]